MACFLAELPSKLDSVPLRAVSETANLLSQMGVDPLRRLTVAAHVLPRPNMLRSVAAT
ncbi:hypothetical protein Mal52_29700 [Symmachiella dynata]|uniref:Uncharacterized protein n=1 Tax=Symmachiella dynata TaxID=2527995 RepID=A0A517ZPT2_9PLAN|nr:hypothetical protein Mal52_29700 [Symmachiella dynata]